MSLTLCFLKDFHNIYNNEISRLFREDKGSQKSVSLGIYIYLFIYYLYIYIIIDIYIVKTRAYTN